MNKYLKIKLKMINQISDNLFYIFNLVGEWVRESVCDNCGMYDYNRYRFFIVVKKYFFYCFCEDICVWLFIKFCFN